MVSLITQDGKSYDSKGYVLRNIDPKFIFKPGESPMGGGEKIKESKFKPIDSAYLDHDPDFQLDDDFDDGMIDARPKSKIPDLKDLDIKTVVELSDWANDAFNVMVANGKDEREAMSCLQANLVNNGFGMKWLWNNKLTKQLLDGSISNDLATIEEIKDFCS